MSVQTRTTALQNEVVRLYCTFELDGRLGNPASQPRVEILDTDGVTVLATVVAQIEHVGIWYVDWFVPPNMPVGQYYDRWTFQWNSTSNVTEQTMVIDVYSLESYINFVSPTPAHKYNDRIVQLMKDLSNDFIYEAMHIPVYWEQGMRVQQENQSKRVKQYYSFILDKDAYDIPAGTVYFNNSQRFTVWEAVTPYYSSSTSSSSSLSSLTQSLSSVSLSSLDSSSSTSYSTSSSNSYSSESSLVSESSSSYPITTTTTTTPWVYKPTLVCVGTGNPSVSGTLTKVSGDGPTTVNFVSWSSKTSKFSTIYTTAYGNWMKDPRPRVRVNNRLVDDGWWVDWNGRIFFDGLMAPEDSVNFYYQFAYFSEEEILAFLNLGLQIMNSQPPASITYNYLVNMPIEWNGPVLLYGAITALKRLIFGLNFQEKAVIFGEPEAARQAIAHFQSLYQDYSTIWQEQAKNAKTRKLYGMAMSVTPEYTLPSGRSRWFRYLFKGGA